jgi:protein O-mannosyl-transferase
VLIAQQIQPATDIRPGSLWARPLIAADSLTFYLSKLILPLHLTFEYGRTPAAVLSDPAPNLLYWTWTIPLAITVFLWRFNNSKLTLAALIFLLGVLPVLGFVPFEFQYHSTVADRYVYVSMLGAALAAAWFLARFPTPSACAAACAVLAFFCTVSFVQAGRWKNTEVLYEYGRQFRAATPLHLFVLGQYKDKESEVAQDNSRPDEQQLFLAQAIADYQEALKMDPLFAQVYKNLTVDLVRTKRIDEAIEITLRRIDVQPKLDPTVRDRPASLHATLGMLYFAQKNYPQAIAELEQSGQEDSNPTVKKALEISRQRLAPDMRQ